MVCGLCGFPPNPDAAAPNHVEAVRKYATSQIAARWWAPQSVCMKVSVFGLGYVGTVSAACLAARGHDVIGVDMNAAKVDLLRSGTAPIVEQGLSDIIRESTSNGRLRATTDAEE